MQEQSQHSLQSGSIINHYRIIRVLGAGGFGITYLAEDIQLGMEVVLKEYFPNEFAIRNGDSTIVSKTASDNDFTKGMQRFKEEAQVLAKFNHPSIVKILGFFQANNTAYFVMEYEEGIDLSHYMKQINRTFTQEEVLDIIMPILEGLKEVHKYNYLHRDIKPGNILLRKNHSPVLIDFGASKLAIGEASKSVTSMLTEGYAPLEQYSTDIKQQGPFTDLYAVGAVIYKMITGNVPPSAQTRSYALLQDDSDPYVFLMNIRPEGFDDNFLMSVDKVLSVKAKDRQQDVSEFQKNIAGEVISEQPINIPKPKKGNKKKIIATLVVASAIVGIVIGAIPKNDRAKPIPSVEPIADVDSSSVDMELSGKKVIENELPSHVSVEITDPLKQVDLGYKYWNGKGIGKDNFKAYEWFKKAADQGNAVAQKNLGLIYANAWGVKKDYNKSKYWYEKAAEKGNDIAEYELGVIYQYGNGVVKDLNQAYEWYLKSAKNGNNKAQNSLGVMYAYGSGITKNLKEATKWYEKSATLGNAWAQKNLADLYKDGRGVTKDLTRALELYEKSANQDNKYAQYELAYMYQKGIAVDKDISKAIDWYEKSSKNNYALSSATLGFLYEIGDQSLQIYNNKSFKWYKLGAKQGNVFAQNAMGKFYYYGKGVTLDYSEAYKWFKKSADLGNPDSQNFLGIMYQYGRGVKEDLFKSTDFYTKSCDGGNNYGCANLGWMYGNGKGVKEDLLKAVKLYKKSCDAGNVNGCNNLGDMYRDGKGIKKNTFKAVKFYTQTCDEDNAYGCGNLGYMYENGFGVKRSQSKAKKFYGKACDGKSTYGCDNYKRLNKQEELIICSVKNRNDRFYFSQSSDGNTIYLHDSTTKKPKFTYIKQKSRGGGYRFYGDKQSIYVYDNGREMSMRAHNSKTGEAGALFAVFQCNKYIRK